MANRMEQISEWNAADVQRHSKVDPTSQYYRAVDYKAMKDKCSQIEIDLYESNLQLAQIQRILHGLK